MPDNYRPNTMKKYTSKLQAFFLTLAMMLFAATSAKADAVSDAITATQTQVTGYVNSIGAALVAVAVLWIGFKVGAKYVRKLGGL